MNPDIKRVLRPRGRARKSYNLLSRWYDFIAASEMPFLKMGIRMLEVQPGESVLEIGCGTGRVLAELSEQVKSGHFTALDISEGMLRIARHRTLKDPACPPVTFCQADGYHLPIRDRAFDAVFLGFTLELFDTPDLPHVLGECHRVLKRSGRAGIVALEKRDLFSVHIYEWFHERLPEFFDCRPIHLPLLFGAAHFSIQKHLTRTMWGLPVAIALARKDPRD